MTSSVIRRNEKLRNLDDQFENVFAQYDEDQIGALEMEDIDGFRTGNDAVLESALVEFDTMMKKVNYEPPKSSSKLRRSDSKLLDVLKEEEEDDSDSGDESDTTETDDTEQGSDTEGEDAGNAKKNYELVRFKMKKDIDDRLDCESIVSTYSTLFNHPAVITEKRPAIELSKKSGLPLGEMRENFCCLF